MRGTGHHFPLLLAVCGIENTKAEGVRHATDASSPASAVAGAYIAPVCAPGEMQVTVRARLAPLRDSLAAMNHVVAATLVREVDAARGSR